MQPPPSLSSNLQMSMKRDTDLKIAAVTLSWGIYGVSVEWKRNSSDSPPEEFIQSAIPYILNGVGSNMRSSSLISASDKSSMNEL